MSDTFEVRDLRGGDWFWSPNAILHDAELTATAKLVYMAMAAYANRFQMSWPSNETISKICEVSDRSVQRAKLQLVKAKYIKVIAVPNKPSKYILLRIPSRGDILSPQPADSGVGVTLATNRPTGVGVTPQHPEQYEQEDIINIDDEDEQEKTIDTTIIDETRKKLVEDGILPR